MEHYAMIPMEEYQEFMEWRKNKRKISASIHKKSKAVEYDDCPF